MDTNLFRMISNVLKYNFAHLTTKEDIFRKLTSTFLKKNRKNKSYE